MSNNIQKLTVIAIMFCSLSFGFFARRYQIDDCPFPTIDECLATLCFDNDASLPLVAHMVIGWKYLLVGESDGKLPLVFNGSVYGSEASFNVVMPSNFHGEGDVVFLSSQANPKIVAKLRLFNGSDLLKSYELFLTFFNDINPSFIRQSCLFVDIDGAPQSNNLFGNANDGSSISTCSMSEKSFFGAYYFNDSGINEIGTISGKTNDNGAILFGNWKSDSINCTPNNSLAGTLLMVIDTAFPASVLSYSVSAKEITFEEYPLMRSATLSECQSFESECNPETTETTSTETTSTEEETTETTEEETTETTEEEESSTSDFEQTLSNQTNTTTGANPSASMRISIMWIIMVLIHQLFH